MKIEKEAKREVLKNIKTDVVKHAKKGGWEQRALLLAYAFVRGAPYRTLEAKINEDKFPNNGALSFLNGYLSYWVFKKVRDYIPDCDPNDIRYDIKNWLCEKNEVIIQEAAE